MALIYEFFNLEPGDETWRRMSGAAAEDTLYAVSAVGRCHHDFSQAPMLSLKSMPRGRAQYRFGRRHHVVRDDTLLVSSSAEAYEVELAGPEQNESFCLFVPHPVAHDMWTAVATSHATQLDDPFSRAAPEFPEIATSSWKDIVRRLMQLRQAFAIGEVHDGEAACLVLDALLRTRLLVQAAGKLPALKFATRTELLRRLLRARDLIDSNLTARRPLDQLARHAGLSRYHLLRSFVCAFGETPGNYAARKRIESAAQLLGTTRLPIAEIASRAGFASQSAFTRSFFRWRGLSPTKHRASLHSQFSREE